MAYQPLLIIWCQMHFYTYKQFYLAWVHSFNVKNSYGRAKAGRPARTYIQQLCEDKECCPEDLPEAMNDREKRWERVRDIRATSTTWWWRWYLKQYSLA